MTDEMIDLTGRLTAIQQMLTFLLARDFVERDPRTSREVAETIINAPKALASGTGLIDAEILQSIQQVAVAFEAKVLNEALAMADHWRASREE